MAKNKVEPRRWSVITDGHDQYWNEGRKWVPDLSDATLYGPDADYLRQRMEAITAKHGNAVSVDVTQDDEGTVKLA